MAMIQREIVALTLSLFSGKKSTSNHLRASSGNGTSINKKGTALALLLIQKLNQKFNLEKKSHFWALGDASHFLYILLILGEVLIRSECFQHIIYVSAPKPEHQSIGKPLVDVEGAVGG